MSRRAPWLAAVGLLGLLPWIVGALLFPAAATLGWFVVWSTAADLLFGTLALVMMAHVAPIRWFTPLRPAAAGQAATMVLLALLFVPVFTGMDALYPWAGPTPGLGVHERELLEARRVWFEPVGWSLRAVALLLGLTLLARILHRLEQRGDDRAVSTARRWSAAGLLLLGAAWVVAAVDWWMGLDPVWFSSILPLQRFSGGMVGACSLAILTARGLERDRALPELPPDLYHALGRLLLTFVILWTYTTYSQLMLQWIAGIPPEIRYWIPRLAAGWSAVLWVLGLGHFVLPFALLLSRPFKRNPRALSALAWWLLGMRLLDEIFAIVPAHPGADPWALGFGALALVAHVGLLGALAARHRGPVLQEALHYGLEYRSR